MTYYEEFGVPADASEQEIRQAHRRLARLLHPDRQSDPELRLLAETQMLRINEMLEVLADPPQRQRYDSGLEREKAGGSRDEAAIEAVSPSNARRDYVMPVLVLGGVALLVGVYLYWPDQSAAVRAVEVKPVEGTEEKSRLSSVQATSIRTSIPAAVVAPAGTNPGTMAAPAPRIGVLASQEPGRELPPAGETRTSPPAVGSSEVLAPAASAVPVARAPGSEFVGTWLYVPEPSSDASNKLYKPEFVQLQIRESNAGLAGEFRSRYSVTDRPISPAMNFRFEGPAGGGPHTFQWVGNGGAAGTVTLKLVVPHSLQVAWTVTKFSADTALVSGTSMLIRKQ